MIPAVTYSTLLLLSGALYVLRGLLSSRKRSSDTSYQRTTLSSRSFSKIASVAGLIVLERIIYRHASSFALGLELTVLKVCRSPTPTSV